MKRFKLKYRSSLRKVILKNAGKVITISNFTKGKLLELGVKETEVRMVPPGVEVDKFTGKRNPQNVLDAYKIHDKKVILTVGRLIERKGQDMVIKALPTVLKRFPDVVYLIVGDGPNRLALEELATSLNLEQKVIFAGLVPDEALPLYYETCDIFIMPSRTIEKTGHVEGFGIVYLEANLCGKPVIGGRSGGVPDAIVDGVTGLLVDPLDSSEIAEAIIKLLSNPELARKMGQAGRIRAQTEFNWDKIVGKLIRVLEEIKNDTP
jgi:phosphatidylinositol alpha-1,6-mannosyltransferase